MTIEERLTQLERKNRRLTMALVLAGLTAGLVITACMGPIESVPTNVKAQSFIVVDEKGKEWAKLGVDKDGPTLHLRDENGKLRAMLNVFKVGPVFALNDENGNLRAGLNVDKDGPDFVLYDEIGVARVGLVTDKVGPGLSLRDENGHSRATLGTGKDGPRLQLMGANYKMQVGMTVDKIGEGSLDIYNPLGKRVVTVQSDERNSGLVIVSDHDGKPTGGIPRH